MAELLVTSMRNSEAPADQFQRLGLPTTAPVRHEHLRAERDHAIAVASMSAAARRGDFRAESPINSLALSAVLADDDLRLALGDDLGGQLATVARMSAEATVLDALAGLPHLSLDDARRIDTALTERLTARSQGSPEA